jgi:hypothetical protein
VRFVFAIVAFVLAAVMIVLGIAQRTVFLGPSSTSLSTTVPGGARYIVIDDKALTAFPGSQTITVSGSDTVFAAYGRSSDVRAWIGDDEYAAVSHDGDEPALTSTVTESNDSAGSGALDLSAGQPSALSNPAGSDLWLEEFTAEKSLTTTINVPEGISVIIASDGADAAPNTLSIAWPADNATPWAGPLILGGAILALLGLAAYIWALIHLRRSRGPRRNVPRGPLIPRLPRLPDRKAIKAGDSARPRSSSRSLMAVVPVMLVTALALSGCSADLWPSGQASSEPTITPTPDATSAPEMATDVPPPSVTVPQLERIVRKIAVLTADADASLNADAIATRFVGPALEQRVANYKIRAVLPAYTPPPALPASPLTLTLPQQSSTWPRVVLSVIQNADDPTIAPTALLMTQASPRANYLVEYAVQLEPEAQVPEVAPATIGAPLIAPDSKLLAMAPKQLAAAYADVLAQGEASASYKLFDAEGDSFRPQVGLEKKTERKAALPTTATLEFTSTPGDGSTVALATNESGAIVAVNVAETEVVKPVDAGATVSPPVGSASAALSGVTASAKGIQSTFAYQLLFHVPAAGSDDKIVLLGVAQGQISSVELP